MEFLGLLALIVWIVAGAALEAAAAIPAAQVLERARAPSLPAVDVRKAFTSLLIGVCLSKVRARRYG
jgi:hypothetical protein